MSVPGLSVEVKLGVRLRRPGTRSELLDEEALSREVEDSGFGFLDRTSEGYLFIANEDKDPTTVPEDLSYLVRKVCFEAITDVLERDHCHIPNFGYMGSMDLVREDELTLIGGAEFEANYFPTEALLLELYRCGSRFLALLERAQTVSGRTHDLTRDLGEQEKAARRMLVKHGIL